MLESNNSTASFRMKPFSLKHAKESWEKLYNVENIDSQLNLENLSKVLHSVA